MISDRQRISHMLKAIEKIFEAADCFREDFMISPGCGRMQLHTTF